MDSKAQKRIEVAKRKARTGERKICSTFALDCMFFHDMSVCGFVVVNIQLDLAFWGVNYYYVIFF